MLEDRINQDIKTALLGGDKLAVSTLRSIKNAILNYKVANNSRDQEMPDNAVIAILKKEAGKRQESADLYLQGKDENRAKTELTEKSIIEKYLPAQLSEEEVRQQVDKAIKELNAQDMSSLGAVINQVRLQTIGQTEGALIAQIAKERLTK
jgi:uncharacterized protein YqeY